MIPFSHAIVDDDGEIIRQFRWSSREAKWFQTSHPSIKVIKLNQPVKVKLDLVKLVGECPF
jgi:general stress protein 26